MSGKELRTITLEELKQMAWESWDFYVSMAETENLAGLLAGEGLALSEEDLQEAQEILAQPVTFADMSYMYGGAEGLMRRGRWPAGP